MTTSLRGVRRPHPEFAVTALLAVASIAVIVGAQNIRIPLTANVVDPRFFPRIVGALLGLCAIAHGAQVARGKVGEPDEGEDVDLDRPGDWRALLVVSAAFIAHALLVQRVGWPIAAVILFGGAAVGLGAKPLHRVALISIPLVTIAFLVFRVGLGVYLPAGPFERFL